MGLVGDITKSELSELDEKRVEKTRLTFFPQILHDCLSKKCRSVGGALRSLVAGAREIRC